MFYTIRRLIILGFVMGWGGLSWYLYRHPQVTAPIVAGTRWVEDAVRIGIHWPEDRKKIVGTLSGQAVKVFNAYSFQLKDGAGVLYNVGLAGIETPELRAGYDPFRRKLAVQARAYLSGLILSNDVRVDLTQVTPLHTGTGIVYTGPTNVNAALVAKGLARLSPSGQKALTTPVLIRVQRAQADAENKRLGLWGTARFSRASR